MSLKMMLTISEMTKAFYERHSLTKVLFIEAIYPLMFF